MSILAEDVKSGTYIYIWSIINVVEVIIGGDRVRCSDEAALFPFVCNPGVAEK